MHKKRADYDGAEALYRRAIEIVVKTFGDAANYKQGIYENNLADVHRCELLSAPGRDLG